jgi:hypothetical protein
VSEGFILWNLKIARLMQEALTALAFILCLFIEHFASSTDNSVNSTFRQVEAIFRDPATQWMTVLCIGAYLVTFATMRNWSLRRRIMPKGNVDLWRAVFLVISTLVYFLTYERASQSTQTAMLLGGVVIGSGAWVNVFWRDESEPKKRSLSRLLTMTVFMLALACFWKFGVGLNSSYGGNPRWVGPWDNPNIYGLAMGAGVVLASGLAILRARISVAPGSRWKFRNRLKCAVYFAAAVAICFGLWKSYSRGAWLGEGGGGLYLLIHCYRCYPNESSGRIHRMRMLVGLAMVLCALLTLLFWQYQHPKSITARRAISTSNRNDLSWRNRMAAWEGALQMMAERPWLGLGWNQPEPFYEHYYSTSRLDETAAIEMNDYLMLGASVGIPALFCFGMYLWLSFAFRPSELPLQPSELDWLKIICRAGALVLAVGFWFDGGLFKLPTAATFWILLELGREG